MPSVLFDFDRAQRNVHNRVVLDIDGGSLVYTGNPTGTFSGRMGS